MKEGHCYFKADFIFKDFLFVTRFLWTLCQQLHYSEVYEHYRPDERTSEGTYTLAWASRDDFNNYYLYIYGFPFCTRFKDKIHQSPLVQLYPSIPRRSFFRHRNLYSKQQTQLLHFSQYTLMSKTWKLYLTDDF